MMPPHAIPLSHATQVPHPLPAARPECHLAIEAGPLEGRERAVLDALLRVDLGARIHVDAAAGTIRMEGRFREQHVRAALQTLGIRFLRIEHRPPTPRPRTYQRGWG